MPVTYFCRTPHAHRPSPAVGHAHARANMVPHSFIALVGTVTGEYVQARLKPVRPALRDFHRLMTLVLVGQHSVCLILEPPKVKLLWV